MVFELGTFRVGSQKSVPHEGIRILGVVENFSGIVNIGERRKVEDSTVEE